MSRSLSKILEENPDLIEAHFLDFLNCLRVREYCGALSAIHRWLVIRAETGLSSSNPIEAASASAPPQDEVDKGFLHAALNLGALYARFEHQEEAFSALKEAIMMAQEANDQVTMN